MAAWPRYQFGLKTIFVAMTACAVFFALLAAALAGSEVASALLFFAALVVSLFGLPIIAYLLLFWAVYGPFWLMQVGWSRLASISEPWVSRLSPKSRRALRIIFLSVAVLFLLTILPKPVQQVVAVIAFIAGLALFPTFVVAGIAVVSMIMERHRYQFSLRAMLLFIAIVAVGAMWLPNVRPIDWLFGIACGEETIYSDGYSTWRWCQLRRGMSKEGVLKLLGPPVKVYGDREEVWHYTGYGPSETYHRREVTFKNGVVVEKYAGLYID